MSVLDVICEKKEKKIFLCHTMYHVLVALSIVLDNIEYSSCAIVIAPMRKPKDNVHYYKNLVKRIEDIGIRVVLINKGGIVRRLFGISELNNRMILRKTIREVGSKKNEYLMINMSWNKQVVVYPASLFFTYCKNAIFIEEGAQLWQTPKESTLYTYCLRLYGNQLNWWRSDKIEYVYAHNPQKLIDLGVPKHKAKSFNLQQIIETYDDLKKKKLCELFVEKTVLAKLMGDNVRKCIVFTQPLSEDGYVSENEKKALFKEICDFYSSYGEVYLKKHPRDNTEYDSINAISINDRFPSEVLSILGINFYVAVGLCTSAIDEVLSDYKMNIGPSYLSDRSYRLVCLEDMRVH